MRLTDTGLDKSIDIQEQAIEYSSFKRLFVKSVEQGEQYKKYPK